MIRVEVKRVPEQKKRLAAPQLEALDPQQKFRMNMLKRSHERRDQTKALAELFPPKAREKFIKEVSYYDSLPDTESLIKTHTATKKNPHEELQSLYQKIVSEHNGQQQEKTNKISLEERVEALKSFFGQTIEITKEKINEVIHAVKEGLADRVDKASITLPPEQTEIKGLVGIRFASQ